ncbi:MAG: gliding motility-associated C-terminal domain-containing protein [Aureispira sp.]
MTNIKYFWLCILLWSLNTTLQAQAGPYPILSNARPIGVDTVQVCMGESATFSSSATSVLGIIIITHNWDFSGAVATNPGNVGTYTNSNWQSSGLYPIIYSAERSIPILNISTSVSDPDTLWLLVVDNPSVIPARDTSTCAGQGVPLEPQLVTSTDSITWFSSSNLFVARADSAWATPGSTNIYQYKAYTHIMNYGIDEVFCRRDLSVRVNVLPPPNVRTINDTIVCLGDSVRLDTRRLLAPLPPGPISYAWSLDRNFNTIIANTRLHLYPNIQTNTTFYVRMTDGNGCTGVDSMRATVRFRPLQPVASVLDSIVCLGDFIALRAQDTSVLNIWRGPNGFRASIGLFDIPALDVIQTGYYTIIARDSFGCPSLPDSVFVQVVPPTPPPAIWGDDELCEGDPINLFAFPAPPLGAILYWIAPNGDSLGGNALNIASDSIHYLSGTWTLGMLDAQGCASVRDTLITIYPAPILGSGMPPQVICEGEDVFLSVSNLVAGVSYSWVDTLGQTALSGASGTISNITNTTVFLLQGITQQLCTYTLDSVTVFVNPTPPTPVIYGNSVFCERDRNIVFSTDTTAAYNWRFNGQTISFQKDLFIDTIFQRNAGTYSLFTRDANGCLSDSATINVVVNARPAKPSIDTSATTTIVCDGFPIALVGTVDSGLTATWIGPNSIRLSGASVVLSPDSSYYGSGIWRLVAVDTQTTCVRRSDTILVTVQDQPSIVVSNSGPVCLGQSAVLTAADSISSGALLNYVWFRDSLLTDTVWQGSTVLINNIQTDTTFYVLASNAAGCVSLVKSTTIQIDVIPPAPNITGLPLPVCEGEDLSLQTTTNALSYQWSGPNGYNSILRSTDINSIDPSDAGQYSLVVSYATGCPSQPAVLNVTVLPIAISPIAIVPNFLCSNDTLYLTTDSSSRCGQLNWIGPNTSNFPLTGNNVIIPPGDSNYVDGAWQVECIDSVTGCSSKSSIEFLIIFSTPPTPIVSPVPSVCEGDTVLLAIASTINTGDIVRWYADSTRSTLVDIGISVFVGPMVSNQTYYVVVTDSNGCSSPALPVPITVIPKAPAPPIIADTAYCEGELIILQTSVSSTNYDWTSSTGWSTTTASAIVTLSASNIDVGTYNLRVRDSFGCWTQTASFDIIAINAPPTVPIASSNSPICDGEDLNLLTNSSCDIIQWYGPIGASSATVLSSDPNYRDNGQWYVECRDSLTGCSSISSTITVTIQDPPLLNTLIIDEPVCVGDDLFAFASASSTSGNPLQYSWYTDATRTTLLGSQDSLYIANVYQSFSLHLVITDLATGCEDTAIIPILIRPLPPTPSILGDSIYCEGDNLDLFTSVNASGYYWTGPNGWVDTMPQTQRVLDIVDAGTYYLSITDSLGCPSDFSSLVVSVEPLPDPVTLFHGGGVCVGQDATLNLSGGSLGSSYDWYQLPGNNYVGTGNSIVLQNVQATDSAYYYVLADLNGCELESDSILLPVYTPNVIAQAGTDQLLCGFDSTLLTAQTLPASVTGIWTSSSAVAIQQPTASNTSVGPLPLGQHVFYWTLSNPSCSNFSTDSVIVEVLPATSEQAQAGPDQRYCGNTSINLAAVVPQIGTGCWTQSTIQSNTGVIIIDTLDPSTGIIGLQEGQQYRFVWQLKNGRCGIYSIDTVIITIDSLPALAAAAGTDQSNCLGDSLTLQAAALSSGQTGTWISLNGGTVLFPNQASSGVVNLAVGSNAFVWSLSTPNCPAYSQDTVLIIVNDPQPIAQADYFILPSSSSTINVIGNDLLTNNWTINVQQSISQGQLTNLNTGEFTVTLSNVTGQQEFIYEVCDAICVNSCDTALVVLSVQQLMECPIPNIFTPNNDGVNDRFEIPCVSEQNSAYLAVYNRWGDEVYRSDNYVNQWDGTYEGAVLPDGTYFYIVQLADGVRTQGSVEIRR